MVGPFTVTVKAAVATSRVDPFTVTAYVPGKAVVAIVNPLADSWPEELMVHDVDVMMTGAAGTCPNMQVPASAGLKLAPVAKT